MIEAMIFDLDGTLVQTEKLKARSYARTAKELRAETEAAQVVETYRDVVGRPRREVARELMDRFGLEKAAEKRMDEFGLTWPWQAFVEMRLRIYEDIISDSEVIRENQWPHNVALVQQARQRCMMVGGEKDVVETLRPVFETLGPGPDKGWGHVGPSGSGHFVKMVHNGIEYGVMEAYAEGFAILRDKTDFELDFHQVAEIRRFGSVIRSWLLDLTAQALGENADLSGIAPYVEDSGEGRWTVKEAIDLDVPAPILTLALQRRLHSRVDESFADKLLAAMRHEFGGHEVKQQT